MKRVPHSGICRRCGGSGPFGKDRNVTEGIRRVCRACDASASAQYKKRLGLKGRQAPKATRAERAALRELNKPRLMEKHREIGRRYARSREGQEERMRYRYGIDFEDWARMFEAQAGLCALCDKALHPTSKNVHVDHCHSSGRVRGLLCHRCNLTLGAFEQFLPHIERVARYIQKEVHS